MKNQTVKVIYLAPLRAAAVKLYLYLRSWNELLILQSSLSDTQFECALSILIEIQKANDAINVFLNDPTYGNQTQERLDNLPPRNVNGKQRTPTSRILKWWRDGMEIVNTVSKLLYPQQTLIDHEVVKFGREFVSLLKTHWKGVKSETTRFLSGYDFSIELKDDKERAPVLLSDEMWELFKEFGVVQEHPTIHITYKSKPLLNIAGGKETVQISLFEAFVVAVVCRLYANERPVMKREIKNQLKSRQLPSSEQLLKGALNRLVKINFLRKPPGKYGYLPTDEMLEVHWESRIDEFVTKFQECRTKKRQS